MLFCNRLSQPSNVRRSQQFLIRCLCNLLPPSHLVIRPSRAKRVNGHGHNSIDHFHVALKYFYEVLPYAEQQRIVEKTDQAFSVLDTIDALQAQYADNLAVLKAKLIDAAIQGKLTEQLPEDGTAEELYQQIQAEKQVLIKAGKIKKEKPLSGIKDEEIPFAIPDNWEWVRFAGITNIVGTGMIRTGNEQFDKAEYYYA